MNVCSELDSCFRRRRFNLIAAVLTLTLSSGALFAEPKDPAPAATPRPSPTPKPAVAPKATSKPEATAAGKPTATPTASQTPDTRIDAKLEAELLQAEDRFVIAIQNGDAKALDELLHPLYADAVEGSEKATTKRGVMFRLNEHRLPAYRVDRERKLVRSGDSFTVEGMAVDAAHSDSDDRPNKFVHVVRIWMREGDRWIATAQTITPEEQWDEQQERERAAEAKEKKP